ncbi:DEKNAAC100165 [Brettanomyces naardenensis]|uniref:DEKNAAC100165 n=1 Tax=Brettanomyces naardenensis TaxID=13370 RepID=A0A448YGC0_BRENA|nr:DEKNAAC100165 [Brettanomyces naardenensis]
MELSEVEQMLAGLAPEQIDLLKKIISRTSTMNAGDIENIEQAQDEQPSSDQTSDGNSGKSDELLEGQVPSPDAEELLTDIYNSLKDLRQISLITGDRQKDLFTEWLGKTRKEVKNYGDELTETQRELNEQFVKSMDTITKIFQLYKCNALDSVDSFDNLSQNLRPIMNDFQAGHFKALDAYINNKQSMEMLNDEAESTILELEPLLKDSISSLCTKLLRFYHLLDAIGGYSNQKFLDSIPSKEDAEMFAVSNGVDDIKRLMSTSFSNVSPQLLEELDVEIQKIQGITKERVEEIRGLQSDVRSLRDKLHIESTDLDVTAYESDEDFKNHIDLKKGTVDAYRKKRDELMKTKQEREDRLKVYMDKVGDLWGVLRPNDNSIQEFLKENKNLKEESLMQFDSLLKELEKEKKDNIAKFIGSSRDRVKGYWDLLMYDDDERKNFKEYYVESEDQFTEGLLTAHSEEIERLRKEADTLKPILQGISTLNQLLKEKKELDESSKDPSRLLRRDSFRILRREEKARTKLSKLLPSIMDEMKAKLLEYENRGGRTFKVDGEPYLNKLEEIEKSVIPRRGHARSPMRRKAPVKRAVSTTAKRTRSMPSIRSSHTTHTTPATSIIRRQTTSDMTNPFVSRETSPVKRKRLNDGSHRTKVGDSRPQSSRVSRTPSLESRRSSDILHSLNVSGGSTVSNRPIFIKGGSPMRHLDYSVASKTSSLQPSKGKPKLKLSLSPHRSARTSLPPANKEQNVLSKRKFRYPTANIDEPKIPPPIPVLSSHPPSISKKRRASFQLQPAVTPVEELSDSLIYFSESDASLDEDKENQKPPSTEVAKGKLNPDVLSQNPSSLNWETDTF